MKLPPKVPVDLCMKQSDNSNKKRRFCFLLISGLLIIALTFHFTVMQPTEKSAISNEERHLVIVIETVRGEGFLAAVSCESLNFVVETNIWGC